MIFIILIFFVGAIIIALNFIDNSNIDKIEAYLEQNGCKDVVYVEGNYQALCSEKVMVIENQFKIDLKNSKTIKYKEIKDINMSENNIMLNDDIILTFKDNKNQLRFYNKLEDMNKE